MESPGICQRIYFFHITNRNSGIDYHCKTIITSLFGKDDEYTESPFDKEKASLLIVEDNPGLLQFLVDKLRSTYNVFYAEDGLAALKAIKDIPPPELIISDIMMDTMNGLAFRKKIKEESNYQDIPFIFLTAKSCEKTKLECLAEGAVDYITKPFSMDELVYKVKTLIKIRRALSSTNLGEIEKRVNSYLKRSKPKLNVSDSRGKGAFYTQYGISDQEIRVISMLKEGLMYKEIASNLNVSLNSVRTYIRRIHKKLNIHSTAELLKRVS